MLAVPRKPKPYQRSLERGHSTDPRDLGALNLPFDILEHIFRQVRNEDIADAVFLALTNSFLRDVGQNRVCDLLLIEYSSPWHLERIVCVGDRLAGDDLPPGVKEREKAQLTGRVHDRWTYGFDSEPVPRLYIDDGTFLDTDARGLLGKRFSRHNTSSLSPAERRKMDNLLRLDFSWDGRPETDGVARLTGSRCDGPWTDDLLSLGHVLLTQICWSSDRSGALKGKRRFAIHRGPWAGHYFTITTVDQLTESESYNCKEYVDVTDKILDEVLELWRDNDPDTLAKHLRPAESSEDAVSTSDSDDNEETHWEDD
ncbi:uncharacterized protein B0H18DRAFT_1208978 [Fomitopsis serialis]|uniref:uncharacterized protein n=1 Tax=Fomitopsis serialis TaxID=139415 RepID=UPI002008DDAC|nr:uncharacterized protein B0H18DRAFT_1208978 [Neoantrodia serialis]KAH9931299.1 hypothetical protein B0H18DRAFT_1208978 [Neoantrodia serialis]